MRSSVNYVVLDSSALLAVLQQEPGGERVAEAMEDTDTDVAISSVNLCEVVSKLVHDGIGSAEIRLVISQLELDVVSFRGEDAYGAGHLRTATQSLGLSLGDRVCLALAGSRNAAAWTTDRVWKKLKTGVKVELIRN